MKPTITLIRFDATERDREKFIPDRMDYDSQEMVMHLTSSRFPFVTADGGCGDGGIGKLKRLAALHGWEVNIVESPTNQRKDGK